MHEGRTQTERDSQRMPGAGLSWRAPGKAPLKCQPSSRTGENPPYGMIGGIEETSASFEARSAPRSYPTAGARSNPRSYRDKSHPEHIDAAQPPEPDGDSLLSEDYPRCDPRGAFFMCSHAI